MGLMAGVFGRTEDRARTRALYLDRNIDQAATREVFLEAVLMTTARVLRSRVRRKSQARF